MNNKVRVIWTVSIGWWLALFWFGLGSLLCLTIVGIPWGYKMIDSTYTVATGKFE